MENGYAEVGTGNAYYHNPFLHLGYFSPMEKYSHNSPHPPISSSGSSSPLNDEGELCLQPAEASPQSSSAHSEDETAPPKQEEKGGRSKRRKQSKPLRCEATTAGSVKAKVANLNDPAAATGKLVKDSEPGRTFGGHGKTLVSAEILDTNEIPWGVKYEDEGFIDEHRNGREEDASTSASSPGSTSPGGRKLVVGVGARNRVFPTAPSGTRIFNPDAYCQLCDKEFCNKYFLRTHKANKHGVYETICDEKTAESTNTAPLMSTLPNTVKEELPPFGPEMFDKISRSSPTNAVPERDDLSTANMEKEMLAQQIRIMYAQNMAMQQMLQRGGPMFPMMSPFDLVAPLGVHPFVSPQFLPQQSQLPALLKPPNMQNWQRDSEISEERKAEPIKKEAKMEPQPKLLEKPEKGLNKVTVVDEGYCSICHKMLCNKSFLRKHMKKRHGIVVETPGVPSDVRKAAKRKSKAERRARRKIGSTVAPNDEQMGHHKHDTNNQVEPTEEAFGQQQAFANLQRLLQTIRDPGKVGRREVFRCNECQTDFATNFFLESHYQKEHGSARIPSPSPEDVLDLSKPKSSRTPPNENGQGALKHKKFDYPYPPSSLQQSLPQSPITRGESVAESVTGGIDLESFCVTCNREYCSKYFLRTHLKKVHGITTEEYLLQVQQTQPEIWRQFVTNPGGESGSPAGMAGSPSVRRNWCKHCRKDFCNKYFFKTHMKKMHNEDVPELTTSGRGNRRRSTSVACDICSKDLCSKYFLKIHKRNAHGIHDPTLSSNGSNEQGSPSVPMDDDDGEEKYFRFGRSISDPSQTGVFDEADDEDVDEDQNQPISMVMKPKHTVISCSGTHFLPMLDQVPSHPDEDMDEI